jgi:hypothetical protein
VCILSVSDCVVLVFVLNSHTDTIPGLLLMGFEVYLVMCLIHIFCHVDFLLLLLNIVLHFPL